MPSMEFLAVLREGLVEFDRRLTALEAADVKVQKRLDELEERHDESMIEAALRRKKKHMEAEGAEGARAK